MNNFHEQYPKQCIESKLGLVHQVHTLAQLVCIGRAHYTQAARTTPYRGTQWRRIVAQHRPCCRPPQPYHCVHACPVPCVSQPPASYRGAPWPYRSPWLPCITTHGRPLSATIQFCIATQLPTARPLCARAAHPASSRPYCGPLLHPGQPSQPLCHDTNCCIVT